MGQESLESIIFEKAAEPTPLERFSMMSRHVNDFLDLYQDTRSAQATSHASMVWHNERHISIKRKTEKVVTGLEKEGQKIFARVSAESLYEAKGKQGGLMHDYKKRDFVKDLRIEFFLPNDDIVSSITCAYDETIKSIRGNHEDVLLALAELQGPFAADRSRRLARERKEEKRAEAVQATNQALSREPKNRGFLHWFKQ